MSKLIRSPKGRLALLTLLFCGVALSVLIHREAQAAPYVNPFWSNTSPSPETAIGPIADLGFARESLDAKAAGSSIAVDARTGELFYDLRLFDTPGVVEDNVFALRWRSMISGSSQLGNGVLPSWETTLLYVLLIPGNPNGPSGHARDVRRPGGRIDRFLWNGTAYAGPSDVFDTLTSNAGTYTLTDKWNRKTTFNADGMPATQVDRNGNTDTLTYSAALKMTAYSDDRGKSYTTAHNASNYMSQISDPAGRTWNFGYSAAANLTTVTGPATADQPSGIVVTLAYDGLNRLTGVTDGKGNAAWSFGYVGTSRQISTVTIDGDTVGYSYASGRTDRTDRNGNVHRTYFTGNQVTKTDMYVASAAKYVTVYRYSGVFLSNVVLPRGNRIDFVFDSNGDLTERRHRTTDTSVNDASDIVHQWAYSSANFMTSGIDPLGRQWTLARDSAGNLTSVTHPTVTSPATQTASESWVFNSKGQVTRHTDEEANNTDYTYFTTGSSSDLLQKAEVAPAGLALDTQYVYDSAGNVATETDPRGKATSYTWDNLRRLTQRQTPSPLSYRVQHHYDGNGNLTSTDVENIDKDGNVVPGNQWITTTRTYTNTDDLATLTEEIDASTTRTTTCEYDNNQNRIRVVKPLANKEKWTYDERDLVLSHVRGEGATGESTEEYVHDDNGNRTVVEDGRDNDTTSIFDLFDRRTKETDALGHYTDFDLDKNGQVTKVTRRSSTNAELQRETCFFDERGRHWKTSALFKDSSQTYADAVMTIERMKTGQVKVVTDPRGKTTTKEYDAALRHKKTTDAMGNEWSYTLDDNGNPTAWTIKEKDGAANVFHDYEAIYDELNRRKTYVEIDRNNASNRLTTQYFHDSRSNPVFEINAEGNPTRWTFDGLSRMIKAERTLALGATINDFTQAQVTQWGFDKNDRLTSHKDDGPNESTWAYDALDRTTTMTYPDAKTVAYQFDKNDNVTQTTDPAGNVVADTFDVLNRNTSRSVTLVSTFLGTTSETRTFDGVGRMVTNEDNDYKVEFEYAAIGLGSLVHKETQSYVGQTAYAKTVTKTYDAAGNRATEAYPSGSNLSLTYAWNDIDNLSSISDGTNTIASDSWIGVRRKTETFQSGAKRTNLYTGFREEIESVRHETSALATIVRLDYAHNKVHDRTYERFGASGSSGDAFAYDKIRRLTTAWMGSSNPTAPTSNSYVKKIDHNYDDDGNRTSIVVTPYQQTPQTTSYTTNNLNEYTAVGGTPQVSDANGNLADNGTHLFVYDYRNHIVQVKLKSTSAVIASYRYDALGRRVEKNVGGTVERYILSIWNDPGVVEDLSHVVSVYDGSDVWKQNFAWSDEADGIQMLEQKDVLDYDIDGNTTEVTRSFYHRNALGSVMEITDMNQAVAVSYRYDPYGKATITRGGTPQTTDPLGNHWTFTGRFLDEEAGLLYYRARHYDPATGRFLQRDPAGYTPSPNLFEYVRSVPTRHRDPTGFDPTPPQPPPPVPGLSDPVELSWEDDLPDDDGGADDGSDDPASGVDLSGSVGEPTEGEGDEGDDDPTDPAEAGVGGGWPWWPPDGPLPPPPPNADDWTKPRWYPIEIPEEPKPRPPIWRGPLGPLTPLGAALGALFGLCGPWGLYTGEWDERPAGPTIA